MNIIKEITIISQCDNPFIVKYYDSYLKEDMLSIVMELCEGGSLADILQVGCAAIVLIS